MVWGHQNPTIFENVANFKYETKSDLQKVLHKIHYICKFTNILLCLFCGFYLSVVFVCFCFVFLFLVHKSLCVWCFKSIGVEFFNRSLPIYYKR